MRRCALPLTAFVAVVLAANVLTSQFGLVHWLGLTATAGTWLAGFGFVARDWLHDRGGVRWVLLAIGIGAALSAFLSPSLALASAVAFAVAEFADFAVYTPLREKSRVVAAVLSNTVGAVIDTVLFLWLAGFPLEGTATQVVIKVGTTTLFVLLMGGVRAVLRQSVHSEGGTGHA